MKHVLNASGLTPPPALSTRKTPRVSLPRSVSPRKTGISGTARRSNGVDIHAPNKEPELVDSDDHESENENAVPSSPTRANHSARRYTEALDNTPLRDITSRNTPASRDKSTWDKLIQEQPAIAASIEDEFEDPREPSEEEEGDIQYQPEIEDDGPIIGGGDDDEYPPRPEPELAASVEPPLHLNDEDVDRTFQVELAFPQRTTANSRRKRKSDLEVPTSSPAVKKSRKETPKTVARSVPVQPVEVDPQEALAESSKAPSQPKKQARARPPLAAKSTNSKASSKFPKELDDVVDRIRARPNPPKSLYVMRRETPADDGVQLTRSGRVSFRPLAYWRNEQCVYGGSPSGAGLKDGARFPLNSIKEIIRTEEVAEPIGRKKSKKRKGRGTRSKSRATEAASSESESDGERVDPDAEPWETEVGTLRGRVSIWDAEVQQPIDEEEEIEIAYAPAAIATSVVNVKSGSGPSFKYAKLLGNKFMGVGLVDLEPGGIKRPKNSRKMHMSFFVVKGRVTVNVGPVGGEDGGSWSRFSIGKGGFWQVPRGESSACFSLMPANETNRKPILDRKRVGEAGQDILQPGM